MGLDRFIDKFFGNVMTTDGLDSIKQIIHRDMLDCGYKYDTAKVEYRVFNENKNYDPRVEISSEGYDDGEIIFIDYYLD